jgi:DNA-binding MarR family transcriptional regulator
MKNKPKHKLAATAGTRAKALAALEQWPAADDPGFLIGDVARAMRMAFDRRVADLGLTRAQWRALVRLIRQDGITQTELATLLDIERASAGTVIERLEAAGFVTRRREPSDRRVWRVFLTPKGSALVPVMSSRANALYGDIFRDLSREELGNLVRILSKVRERLKER